MAGLVVVALVAALMPAVAARAATAPAAGVSVKLAHSDKCLNVMGASTANNAKIVQYFCVAAAQNDKFKIVPRGGGNYWIQGIGSGKCLNVLNNSQANGASIIQYGCGPQLNTLWKVDEVPDRPTVRFISASSGKCLNLPQASTANNVNLIQYYCTSTVTATNEQFYLPPTASGAAVHRPFTAKQPIAVVQGAVPAGGGVAPVHYSYVSANNQLSVLTDRNPDPENTDPNAPAPLFAQTTGYGYTGRTDSALMPDGRVQVVGHEAAAGDVVLLDEATAGTGDYGYAWDIGGALSGQPTVANAGRRASLATLAVVNGALWWAPETGSNAQTPYGAWRSLGGTGLAGTPVGVPRGTVLQVFVLNTAGQLMTATFQADGTTLSDWASLGGSGLTGTPAVAIAAGAAAPRASVFVRSADGTIVTKRQAVDGSFPAEWTTIPGLRAAGAPSAVMNPYPGQVAVAARGADNLIYLAYETGQDTGQYGDWTLISDPDAHPETVAASDPTAFAYDVPSGPSFGIAFQSVDDVDLPVVILFESAQPAAGSKAKVKPTGVPHPTFHKLKKPKKTVRLK
jgi:hypothetical protein